MSTAARKARKRNHHANLAALTHLAQTNPFSSQYDALEVAATDSAFYHSPRTGTPIAERAENQPRDIFGKGPRNPATRHGLTHGARRRLTAAGLVIDGDTVKQPGWFRRLFGTGSAAA